MEKNQEYICTLEKSLNHCPHYDGEQYCNNSETGCGMLRIVEKQKKYIRKERWYEKYYR